MNIRRISDFQGKLSFPDFDSYFDAHLSAFYRSDLGKIHQALPWEGLVRCFGLKRHAKGPEALFSPRGKVALMVLKHHSGCSDRKLLEQLNGNLHYQIFCDLILPPGELLTNFKIISQIRCELAGKLDIDASQAVLMQKWRPLMSFLQSVFFDATCYESSIRYPTDQKLLFEAVVWVHAQLKRLCRQLRVRMPRTKYTKWARRYTSYSKMRKKTTKKRRPLTRGLLKLLKKLNGALAAAEAKVPSCSLTPRYHQRRVAIQKILDQQSGKFFQGQRPHRAIVSIDKPYIRPIVRGKEVKPVEFGAKVHKLQIDGISFIEHLSFEAFHEGNRLPQAVLKAQQLTHTKVKTVGADAIYATNDNRSRMTKAGIQTDFRPKGRKGKHRTQKLQLQKIITSERASKLEGSFGTDKEYFLLNKIKARNQKTETLWIFFGIHTANALNIGRRMAKQTAIAA